MNLVQNVSTFFQCFGNWQVKSVEPNKIKFLHAHVAFAFGEIENAGYDANATLSIIANELQHPTIAQGEVAYYLEDFPNSECISLNGAFPDIQHVDSRHVAIEAVRICKQQGWRHVGVLAHPHHQWRCAMLLKKQGLIPYYIDCSSVKYSRQNNQPWVRGGWRLHRDLDPRNSFIPREFMARILFLLKGWI